ncbi:hypothetical protein EON64_10210 [archaeon]|nr:MAG: hypothetical protein EON64_10210 [archaeon]
MTDRLSMSLDDIISTKDSQRKKTHNSRPNKPKVVKSANRPAPKIQAPKPVTRQQFQVRVTDEDEPSAPARGAKIINIERSRPKVVLPTQTAHPVSTSQLSTASSVFERLGGPTMRVVFSNLAKSVERNDVLELCNAVGTVKQIFFERDVKGLGQAKIVFENERDSYNCVSKYNGEGFRGWIRAIYYVA